jgi:hypothetical protein
MRYLFSTNSSLIHFLAYSLLLIQFAFAQSQDACKLEDPIQFKILDNREPLIIEEKQSIKDNSSKQIQLYIDKDVVYFIKK